ncbi:hypothetical protein F5X99DRAFT_379406 [Biscogniauxia marginata]|nr:hypothetical protein F5X99DRAFT_379406 [Biscogniauxia marginata]
MVRCLFYLFLRLTTAVIDKMPFPANSWINSWMIKQMNDAHRLQQWSIDQKRPVLFGGRGRARARSLNQKYEDLGKKQYVAIQGRIVVLKHEIVR